MFIVLIHETLLSDSRVLFKRVFNDIIEVEEYLEMQDNSFINSYLIEVLYVDC